MNKETLVNEFSESLRKRCGIFFVGSGISVPSDCPTWFSLLTPMAKEIGLEISSHDDLTEVAQYIVNDYTGNKAPVISKLFSIFSTSKKPNKYHTSLACTNLKKIWTTNFDTLIEDALRINGIEARVITNNGDFLKGMTDDCVEIIKMHGCIQRDIEDIVFIQEDYEDFFVSKQSISDQLKSDLVCNSFLFIGYSFGDPNIRNILTAVRRSANGKTRTHYLIQIKDQANSTKQQLWCKNLKRYGIQTLLIDDFKELDEILYEISQKSKGNTIYVTGSHAISDSSPANTFAQELGNKLAMLPNVTILDGQSTGISRECISNYTKTCLNNCVDIHTRITLFPNPYAINRELSENESLIPTLKLWRSSVLRNSRIVIMFDGGLGTKTELELAKQYDAYILPIPFKVDGLAYETLMNVRAKVCPKYFDKAHALSLTVDDVIACISSMLTT